MEIIIQDKNAFQNTLQDRSVLWKIYFKKNRKVYLIQFAIGALLLIIGFSPLNTSVSQTEYINYMTHQHEITYHRNEVNLVGATGIAYILLLLISIITLRKGRKRSSVEADRFARLIFKQVNEATTTINNEGITYQTPATTFHCSWIIIPHFSIYKNYLVLNLDPSGDQLFLVNQELLPEQDARELLTFLRQRIRQQ
jgi:hypothetical protein